MSNGLPIKGCPGPGSWSCTVCVFKGTDMCTKTPHTDKHEHEESEAEKIARKAKEIQDKILGG